MIKRVHIRELLSSEAPCDDVRVMGWVRTRRDSKEFSFVELNDGSCLANLQVVVDAASPAAGAIRNVGTGAAIAVCGELVASPGGGQQWEILAREIELVGGADDSYPLQKKRHTDEYLRTIAHLRPRTNKYGALFRIRSALTHAIYSFFNERGFCHVHTPILTGSDCEGAGEMFQVTTLDLLSVPKNANGVDYSEDFFGKEANLTVSGQLALENYCLSLGDVYTFGPTFRSENSNTSRHAAEFWMLEPEMAFAGLEEDMALAEELVRFLVGFVLEHCAEDLSVFTRFVDKTVIERLNNIQENEFLCVPYAEAIDILRGCGRSFEFEPDWGKDLQSEHERFLVESHFKKPVIVFDYPREIKAFYMRLNADRKTVAAMDVLMPAVGELIGGSQREDRYDELKARIEELGFDPQDYWWYLDLRRYGSVPHAGFGLGFERLLMLVTGITNIRDVIPFPRTPKHLEF